MGRLRSRVLGHAPDWIAWLDESTARSVKALGNLEEMSRSWLRSADLEDDLAQREVIFKTAWGKKSR